MTDTQVAIVGAGPAGMFLAHLLHRAGISCVVLERRERDYVEGRVRAGVLEQITANLMVELGLGARMQREGLPHAGTNLAAGGELLHIDFRTLTGGSTVTVYGQSEVMKDLNDAAVERGLPVIYGAEHVALAGVDGERPTVTYTHAGRRHELTCEFVAGCDGSHGVSRGAIPAEVRREFERVYPFGWLGILADVPPCHEELIYVSHERGFALASMRSTTRSRYYLQCGLDERVEDWSDARFWDELCVRLGPQLAAHVTRGPSFEKSIAPLRSWVCEPMSWGRLYIAGDAAHIVPPTGAKGLNLAVSDVILLARALRAWYAGGSMQQLEAYSGTALERVWNAERFSWWFTNLTHRFADRDSFDRRMQLAELNYLRRSRAAQTALAENYVGIPLAGEPL